MAKTWLFVDLYVDNRTGEYIQKIDLNKDSIKKKLNEKKEFKGKYNILKRTWLVERTTKQLELW